MRSINSVKKMKFDHVSKLFTQLLKILATVSFRSSALRPLKKNICAMAKL